MYAVILGCGRVGTRLARALSRSDRVTVIDWNASAFERLGPAFAGQTLTGNGIDVDVLRGADIEQADLFVALTDGDNRNLMAAQIAHHVGVSKVIARVYDPERAGIFSSLGMTIVSPTVTGAERLFHMLVDEG